MSLTNTTPDDEQKMLERLVEKIKDSAGLQNVYDRLVYVNSKPDAVTKLMQRVDAKKEVRYATLEFLGYDDDETEGDDDCPICILIYRFHLFFQFVDDRPDGSNSSRDFTAAVLRLRKDFLESREISSTDDEDSLRRGVADALRRENTATLSADRLTGINGHTLDFLLRVKHYGN